MWTKYLVTQAVPARFLQGRIRLSRKGDFAYIGRRRAEGDLFLGYDCRIITKTIHEHIQMAISLRHWK